MHTIKASVISTSIVLPAKVIEPIPSCIYSPGNAAALKSKETDINLWQPLDIELSEITTKPKE
jgi:hypothetical protein